MKKHGMLIMRLIVTSLRKYNKKILHTFSRS